MSIYRRGEVWWLYIKIKGHPRVRQSCETSDRERAQAVHDQVRAELRRLRPDGRSVHDVLDAWKAASPRDSADAYRVEKFKRLYEDGSALFADDLLDKIPASSPGTFNRYANIIKAAFALAKLDVPDLPYRKPPRGRLRWLTPKEWRALRRQLPAHLKDMAEFALLTGLRQKNVTHLEWSQVDLKRKTAWIHADQAKAGEPIGVPLSPAAVAVLKRQPRGQWVFPYEGHPMKQVKGAWKKALARAKLKGVTWHTLRHTWASWHTMAGTPIPVLKELGAWKTLSMVSRYSHLAPEHLRAYAGNVSRYQATTQGHSRRAGKK